MKKLLFVSFSLSLLACCFVIPISIAQEAEWVDVSTLGPSVRATPAMVYDEENNVGVLFGGGANIGGIHNDYGDTWIWDSSTRTWTEVTPTDPESSPSKRRVAGMAYYSNGKAILFGGITGTGGTTVIHYDTWIWDSSTRTWNDVTPEDVDDRVANGTWPAKRGLTKLAYDSARDRVVLFGGWDGYNYFGDTWEWDDDNRIWIDVTPSGDSPSGRYSHDMAYDGVNGIVLFGGNDRVVRGDTWIWDGTNWQEVTPEIGPSPSRRESPAMAYDSTSNRVILFGGLHYDPKEFKDDTWEWDGNTRTWTDISTPGPDARLYHAMAYDSENSVMVLFGGVYDPLVFLDDTWEYGPVCIENEITATDPDGNSNYCSSIQEAVDLVDGEGWEITVGSGEYDEYVLIRGKVNLAIRTSCAAEVKGFMLQKCNNITIDGFTIDAEGSGANGVTLMGGNNDNSDVTITNCDIHGAGNSYSGIKAARGNPNTTIIGNHIHHNGRNGIVFIDAAGGPHFITNNVIEANGWNGLKVARQHEITLTGNTITANGTRSGTTGGRYGVLRERTTGTGWPEGITLINNVITDNNGTVQTGKSSIDLGNYDQMLDETDSGNTTTSGDEGPGVS